jgi:hypothetical protein
MADAQDLKSCALNRAYGFESHLGYLVTTITIKSYVNISPL